MATNHQTSQQHERSIQVLQMQFSLSTFIMGTWKEVLLNWVFHTNRVQPPIQSPINISKYLDLANATSVHANIKYTTGEAVPDEGECAHRLVHRACWAAAVDDLCWLSFAYYPVHSFSHSPTLTVPWQAFRHYQETFLNNNLQLLQSRNNIHACTCGTYQ